MSDTQSPETPPASEPSLVEIVVRGNVSYRLTMVQALQYLQTGKTGKATQLLTEELKRPALRAAARIEALMLKGILGAVTHGLRSSQLQLSAEQTLRRLREWISEQTRAADIILEDTRHDQVAK